MIYYDYQNPDVLDSSRSICPYCGSNRFRNNWGKSNAVCGRCQNEFIVYIENGQMKGKKVRKEIDL